MPRIELSGVHVSQDRTPILRNIDLALYPGEFVGIVGPNGAGKSTLARAILGLLTPASGRILIDGLKSRQLSRADVARKIAYLAQGQSLHWPLSVERLVALGRLPHLAPFSKLSEKDRAAIEAALTAANIAHLRSRDATTLSGGEQARALLACALAVEAGAMIVDEPLAALDPAHQLDVMNLLKQRADGGMLVAAILHDLGMAARYCDRLLLLHEGELVAEGPPHAVLTPERFRTVYGIRARLEELSGTPVVVPTGRA